MVREGLRKKHKIFWSCGEDLYLKNASPFVTAREVTACAPDSLCELAPGVENFEVAKFDAAFIRKNPPFDGTYLQVCWLLSLVERKVYLLNRPSLLLRYHEKLIPQEAVAKGALQEEDTIPTFLNNVEEARSYFEKEKVDKIISKPFFGFGGGDIQLFSREEFEVELALNTGSFKDCLLQPFQEEIREGDFRVFILDGVVLASFCRMPKAGGFVSNLAQGGTAVSKALTAKQKDVLNRLAGFLKGSGIMLAGADLIGDKISEVNVTSPTGLQNLLALEGRDYGADIIRHVERSTILFPF